MGNGPRVGGGLLLYRTAANVNDTRIMGCQAAFGGGVFIRSDPHTTGATDTTTAPKTATVPGPRLRDVTVTECVGRKRQFEPRYLCVVQTAVPQALCID